MKKTNLFLLLASISCSSSFWAMRRDVVIQVEPDVEFTRAISVSYGNTFYKPIVIRIKAGSKVGEVKEGIVNDFRKAYPHKDYGNLSNAFGAGRDFKLEADIANVGPRSLEDSEIIDASLLRKIREIRLKSLED